MRHLISIEDSIKDILLTPLGSRVMRPNYGSRLFELVDKRVDDEYKAQLTAYVVEAVHKNEPRIKINKVVFKSRENGVLKLALELAGGEVLNVSA